jgi:hypothetical protein
MLHENGTEDGDVCCAALLLFSFEQLSADLVL